MCVCLSCSNHQGDGAFDFLAEEERASKHAKGTLDPGFNEQQMAVLEDTEVLVGQRDGEINNIGAVRYDTVPCVVMSRVCNVQPVGWLFFLLLFGVGEISSILYDAVSCFLEVRKHLRCAQQ